MERSNNLPPSWTIAKLGEVCNILMGQSPTSDTYNQTGEGLPFFQGKAEFTTLHPQTVKWCSKPIRIAEPNDILLSVRAPVGSTNMANQKCCIGRGLAAIRFTHNPIYLFYYLRLIEKQLDEKGTGSTFKAISGDTIRNTFIPLPPLPEQHRIVSKLEELFNSLDSAVAALRKAKEQVKTYKQAVLKYASSGKLKIRNEELKINEATGLPEGWKWKQLKDVANVIMGQSPPGDTYNIDGIGMPLINGPVEFGKDSLSKTIKSKFTTKPTKICEENDLILCVRGSTTGRTNIAGFKACLGRGVAAIRAKEYQSYLNYYIISKRAFIYDSGTGSTFPNITTEKLKEIIVAIPSNEEQIQIVSEIETRFSEAENLEKIIDLSLKQAESLRQSILKKAFEGRLVPQYPEDEPAAVLLERIKKEKIKN